MANAWTHDSVNNKSVDWYTPPDIFESLAVDFDLDPAAPIGGVKWIPAKHHFSVVDDGLVKDWFGRVWLNPPYGKETKNWLKKMHTHRNGIALLFARTDTGWYHNYVKYADAILFLRGRIKFVDGLGVTGLAGAGSGSMLMAWGQDNVAALKRLKDKGHLVVNTAMEVWRGE